MVAVGGDRQGVGPLPSTGLPDECCAMARGGDVLAAGSWALPGLAPDTPAAAGRRPRRERPYALAVAPDGDHA